METIREIASQIARRDNTRTIAESIDTKAKRLQRYNDWIYDPTDDTSINYLWNSQDNAGHPDPAYFDYYYTGSDVTVTIDDFQLKDMPIAIDSFAVKIEQEKAPLYGFWNYTYNTTMKGTRMVSGAFSMVTRYPNFLTNIIALSAAFKQKKLENFYVRQSDDDEDNIEKYWRRNQRTDYGLSKSKYQHLFSSHPPFNFIVTYGVQPASITVPAVARTNEILNQYKDARGDFKNLNDRLVPHDGVYTEESGYKRIIEDVELVNMATEYDNSGNYCIETYSFFAKDMYYPTT